MSAKRRILGNKILQELILKNVVIHYIETPEPIGSKELKESLDLNVSPATIRNYFKKLVSEGYLDQLHSSSGRIPTSMAFKEFWNTQLHQSGAIAISDKRSLLDGSKFFGTYSIVRVEESNRLLNVYNVEDQFLLLNFEDGETAFKHDRLLQAFLTQFSGYDIVDLLKISSDNRVDKLTKKLNDLLRNRVTTYNIEELISISKENSVWSEKHFNEFFTGEVINKLDDGIYFEHFAPKDHMIIKKCGFLGEIPISILILGHMSRDFNRFLNSI